jgi:23S rRNA (adenine2030-N6)-methyltransferase
MNYRHAYHAGNFADVFKHAVLVCLLKALHKKEKGFAYIETHAGAGRHDLKAPESQKTGEYRDGIGRVWESPPEEMADFLAAVRDTNRAKELRYYPGSPRVARFFLRPQDRMRLCEAEPGECERLRAEFARDKQVEVRCDDGYAALRAWLPPPERRGVVLIDPPYETTDEWRRAHEAIVFAVERWPTGIYAVWYPLKAGAPVERFKAGLVAAGLRDVFVAEFSVWPDDVPFRLNGCGVLVVNPPWQFDNELEKLRNPLTQSLKQGVHPPETRLEWLVRE